jgi:hypothetical protein
MRREQSRRKSDCNAATIVGVLAPPSYFVPIATEGCDKKLERSAEILLRN